MPTALALDNIDRKKSNIKGHVDNIWSNSEAEQKYSISS